MAPQADVELIRQWFDGLARGELGPELVHPEIEIHNWAESPVPGPYHGHAGLHRWWADLADAFPEAHFEFREAIVLDDRRVLTTRRTVDASG